MDDEDLTLLLRPAATRRERVASSLLLAIGGIFVVAIIANGLVSLTAILRP
jgi:hypothetical protein